jgi:Conserved protein/domain typically associated with flavoprotein oxygenases, DIM6/NTAB family
MAFAEISPKKMSGNVFKTIGDGWMLITAGNAEKCNTMTASWGGLGVLWQSEVSIIFVRHSRYTFQYVEKEDYYSLCFFDEEYREKLDYLGNTSGRDEDKIAKSGLTKAYHRGVPYFEEAKWVFICKKLYSDDLGPDKFIEKSIDEMYQDHDYHRMYIGRIETALKKED